MKGQGSRACRARCAKARFIADAGERLAELHMKRGGSGRSLLVDIPVDHLFGISNRLFTEADVHRAVDRACSLALSAAIASSARTNRVRPASMSATRRVISAFHSGCSAGAGSTVSANDSINSARSSGLSFMAAASRASSFVVMASFRFGVGRTTCQSGMPLQ